MFGYVKAEREELTLRQDTLYRAAYCGLCKEMGRCTGQCSRMTLSYDVVFLYLVRAALTGTLPEVKKGRCLLHPLHKKQIVQSDAELRFAARVSALLSYGKLCDDLADERGFKRVGKYAARPFLAHAKKKADLSALYETVHGHLASLAEIEGRKLPSVDAPAEVFGALLADVFAYDLQGEAAKLAREIGYRTGRFIYAADAADDMAEDAKTGGYNPFLLLYGGTPDAEQRDWMEKAAQYDLQALAAAVDLIDDHPLLPIIKNIIYLGMPKAFRKGVNRE